jgi:predicted DCC family thiol-disulfide oxidoreductase YuxK
VSVARAAVGNGDPHPRWPRWPPWTGGQYSLVRAALGLYLAVHFARLLPFGAEVFSSAGVLPDGSASPLLRLFPNVLALADSPGVVQALLALVLAASLALALGWRDRIAALVLAYVWACLFGRNPLIANPSLPYVGWMLVAHACLPRAPYGSLEARGRVDPDGGWTFPRGVFVAAWIALAVGYSYSGLTKLASPSWLDGTALERVLANPLARPGLARDLLLELPAPLLRAATWGALGFELLFAPLALVRRVRPFLWTAMLAMHLALIALIDFADLSFGMVCLHLFTFDPAWIPRKARVAPVRVFYDGECALCHGLVRFVLAEDRAGDVLRLAPLQGPTLAAQIAPERRAALPDSIVVLDAEGRLFTRSDAALHVLEILGGAWRALAVVARVVPRPLRDLAYDGIASVRKKAFGTTKTACPLMPPELAARFDE